MTQENVASSSREFPVRLILAFLGCLSLIAVFVIADLMYFAQGQSFKREGGGLENVSAVLYGVAAVIFFVYAPRNLWRRLFHVPAILILFAMREMDFDKAFTESGILSLRLYSGGSALSTKLIAAAAALFAAYVIMRTALLGAPAVWKALRAGLSWPWFALLAAALVVFTKTIDGLGRKLIEFGIAITKKVGAMASLIEEVGEVFIPVCAILAIVACWKGTRQ